MSGWRFATFRDIMGPLTSPFGLAAASQPRAGDGGRVGGENVGRHWVTAAQPGAVVRRSGGRAWSKTAERRDLSVLSSARAIPVVDRRVGASAQARHDGRGHGADGVAAGAARSLDARRRAVRPGGWSRRAFTAATIAALAVAGLYRARVCTRPIERGRPAGVREHGVGVLGVVARAPASSAESASRRSWSPARASPSWR